MSMTAAVKPVAVAVEIESKRHRRIPASSGTMPVASNVTDDETDRAADLIAILADALESIMVTTTDASARAVAAEALTTFHGR